VSKKNDKQEIAELEHVNAQLTSSLARCRHMLADYRSMLAANTNSPEGERGDRAVRR